MWNEILETADFLSRKAAAHLGRCPQVALILGSGLGPLADEMDDTLAIPYREVPHFPLSTVEGHSGNLLLGRLGGQPLLAMQGRFHYYEGYTMQQVTYPIRVMRELGVKILLVSNAAGGVSPDLQVGDIMLIADHINFFPEHPLRGRNPYGDRFPDMSRAYDPQLRDLCRSVAREQGIGLREGVYLGTQGPSYETPAESRMFHRWGADAVGMSTVPEVIVARHCGIRVLGLSVITNLCIDGQPQAASHEEVQQAARRTEPQMKELVRGLIGRLPIV